MAQEGPSQAKFVWLGLLAAAGIAILYFVFTAPSDTERAAQEVWDEYSVSERENLCEAWNAGEDYFDNDATGDAIRGVLDSEC